MATYEVTGDGVGPDGSPNGDYPDAGEYGGERYYERGGEAFAMWWYSIYGQWLISTAPGVFGVGWWSKNPPIEGEYSSNGDYGGTPDVAIMAEGDAGTYDWANAAEDRDWQGANWTHVENGTPGNWPGDGGTARFVDKTIDMPNANLPAAGTISFAFADDYPSLDLTTLLDDGASIGDIGIDGGAIITPSDGVTHNFGTATVIEGALFAAGALCHGDVVLAGGQLAFGCDGGLDGDVLATADSTMNWNAGFGVEDLTGSFDAAGHAITHMNPTGAKLTCDNAANLDLGANVPELDIEVQANTALTRALKALNVTLTAGTLSDGGLDSELLGSFVRNGGTFASTGVWTFSGSGDLKNAAYGGRFGALVISGAMVNTGTVYTRKATITGTLGGATNKLTFFQATAGWWGPQTGEVNCDVAVYTSKGAPGNDITLKDRALRINTNENNSLTLDAAIDTGAGALRVYGDGNGVSQTLVIPGHRLRCGALAVGDDGASTGKGIVTFTGSGVAEIGSFAAKSASNVGNQMNLGAYTFLMGGLGAGADVAVTADHAHVHDGTLEHLDEAGTSGTILRFGDSSGDNNNGNMSIVQCPSPLGRGLALMAA